VAILVDDAVWPARGRRWAHLVSDADLDELHRFAAALGLDPRLFHRDHYDLPSELREQALAHGAVAVSSRVLVRRLRASGLRRRRSQGGQLRGEVAPGGIVQAGVEPVGGEEPVPLEEAGEDG
jgi:hypothetical protein